MKTKWKQLIRNATQTGEWNMNQSCQECGLMHPPTAPGQCPVAKAKKIEVEAKTAGKKKFLDDIPRISSKLMDKIEICSVEKLEDLFKIINRAIDVVK